MRKLAAKAFVPRRVETLRPRVRQLTGDLLDQLAAAGTVADLIAKYASPLPVQVMCELLGVPVEDRDSYRHWADAFTAGVRAPVFPVYGKASVRGRDALEDALNAVAGHPDAHGRPPDRGRRQRGRGRQWQRCACGRRRLEFR
jgi:cytochrome P450